MRDPREVLTRDARPPDAVLHYGEHPEQLLDVHLPPQGGRPAPTVLLVHGGFWRQAYDRRHTRPMAEALAAEGFVVLTAEFRRVGGDGGWPTTGQDVAAALAYVPEVDRVAPGCADLADVRLVGHSAGGHLAMWAALRQQSPTPVTTVVALAPVADLHEAWRRGLGNGAVEDLVGGSPAQRPDGYADADAAGLLPGAVPVTVIHGTRDDRVPVEMSRSLPGVRYVELADVEHFGLIDPLSPAWPHVLAAVRRSG